MRGKMRNMGVAAAVLLAAAFLAPGVSAQATASPADAQVKSTPAEWAGAARALAQSATQAPASEASFTTLIAAANAYSAGGRYSAARRVALQAATRAQRAGFDVTAARGYLAAAMLSEELHEPDVARAYYAQCRQLADLVPAVRRS